MLLTRPAAAHGKYDEGDKYREGEGRLAAVRWLRLGIVVALLLPTVFFLLTAWNGYGDAVSEARSRVDRSVRVGLEHAARVIETNQVIARQVLEAIGDDDDVTILRRERALHEQFGRVSAGVAHIQSIWIWGAQGHPLVSNRFYPAPRTLDVSDREYFRYHRGNPDGWFFSQRLISRVTGEPFFDVTHRRQRPGGSFAGVVSVSMYPSHFVEFYAGLARSEPGLAMILFRQDGSIIARWPMPPQSMARLPASSPMMLAVAGGASEGQLDLVSAVDGQHRLVSFRRLAEYPIYIAGGLPRQAVLGAWYREVGLLAAFAFPTSLGLAYVSFIALRRVRREFEVAHRLQDETRQRERAEEALRQAQKLEAMGRLTGGVAHDFNNLLMVVGNNLYLLERLQPQLAGSPQIAAIGRAISSGENLTRQLLSFSRRQALRPEVIRLQDNFPALLAMIRPALGRGIEVTGDVAPDVRPVEVDPSELQLAIINLAVNAKDAMPHGGRLTITARNLAPGEVPDLSGDFVVVSVADTGEGIAPELVEKVFEPFFTTKPPGKGTGLGLSQVYALCAQAGGSARVQSRRGRGTTVHLYLRAATALDVPAPRGEPAAAGPLRCRVLLVEDNQALAEATRPILEALGCSVRHVASADQALEIVRHGQDDYDVVLSDIVMPGTMDGLALAREILNGYPGLQVILMTGYAAQLHNATQLKVDVLPKPCSPQVLQTALARAMGRRWRSDAS
ncbi:MAG: response regulator [Burkholderiales bacterium]|nr:response regulator [Burkholderiales bacterium]